MFGDHIWQALGNTLRWCIDPSLNGNLYWQVKCSFIARDLLTTTHHVASNHKQPIVFGRICSVSPKKSQIKVISFIISTKRVCAFAFALPNSAYYVSRISAPSDNQAKRLIQSHSGLQRRVRKTHKKNNTISKNNRRDTINIQSTSGKSMRFLSRSVLIPTFFSHQHCCWPVSENEFTRNIMNDIVSY